MAYRTLRVTLRNLVLGTLATSPLAGCVGPDYGCDPILGEIELVGAQDDEVTALLAACESGGRTFEACEPLCRELIGRARQYELDPEYDTVETCVVTDVGEEQRLVAWSWMPECIGGRRPEGYTLITRGSPPRPSVLSLSKGRPGPLRREVPRNAVGAFFAEQARLEAASVAAFHDVGRALAAHGAPRVLIAACRRAAAEETVHASLCARLAARHGVVARAPALPRCGVPTLEALARANAAEGCVRETYGATVAMWQAHAAGDPAVRAVMRRIAPDEASHATLSRAIDRWAHRRLDAGARARIAGDRAAAIAELDASLARPVAAPLITAAGLPSPAVAARLLSGLRTSAWA